MKVISTNIARPTSFLWNGKEEITGIYKKPTLKPIYLGKEKVEDDEISDRKVHGGIFKACYLFSADQYPHWKNLYPELEWTYGMLGENLTISELDETQIFIGDIYRIGGALVQITQPREPCYKFGVKFGTQKVLKQFIEHGYPGTYVRIIEEGIVTAGDDMKLLEHANGSITISQFFELLYAKNKNQMHLKLVMKNDAIPISKRVKLKSYLKI
jgi:MOSC domain-containing protein YiiM